MNCMTLEAEFQGEKPTKRFLVRLQQLKVVVDPARWQSRAELERKTAAKNKVKQK